MYPVLPKAKWLSGRSGLVVAALLVLLVCGGIFFVAARVDGSQNADETLRVSDETFSLEVASTSQAQGLGLGNRASLPANHGMLFVLSGMPAVQCFWMKDMRFPIDIIWINAGHEVVHIEPNVSPDTYPKSFCPDNPAKYVIELNAGAANSAGIRKGETLNF